MSPRLLAAAPAAAIAVIAATLAILAILATPTRPATPPAVAASGPVAALDGLAPGDRLAGWRVVAITPTLDGGHDVALQRDELRFVFTVVALGVRSDNPPFSDRHHALYYGHATPAGREIPAGALRAISAELLRRLARAQP
ncbi:MAG: hypothetical protein K1X88_13185 [Nannocystaceae bacterium]|nr:hypothetical protein [Nannocystaceae bacterium]